MLVDLIRQHAEWYADGVQGVNVQLAAVPRDVGISAPPAVTIYNVTADAWVARGTVPRDKTLGGPLLLVTSADDFKTWVRSVDAQENGGASLGVSVVYVARKNATDDLVMDCWNTLRTVARVVSQRFNGTKVTPYVRNGIDIYPPDDVRFVLAMERLEGDELVAGGLVFTHRVTDPWALANISP